MIWFLYRLVCFLVVFQDGSVSEVYNGRVTPANNNRAAFARANGQQSNVKLRYQRKTVREILWEVQ